MNKKTKIIVQGIIIILFLLLEGCAKQTIMKYQCASGTFVDSISACESSSCPQPECPELNCTTCPNTTEKLSKSEKMFVCTDGIIVNDATDCFKTDNLVVVSSGTDKYFTSMDGQTAGWISITGVLENKGPKEIIDYDIVGYLKKDGQIVAASTHDTKKMEWIISHDNVSIRPGEKRAFDLYFYNNIDYDNSEAEVTYKTS